MSTEAERSETPVREFQLEGFALISVGLVLVVALAGAFYLGRWYERRSSPGRPVASSSVADAGEASRPEPVDAEDSLTVFDAVTGKGQEAEPRRQAAPPFEPSAGTKLEAPARGPAVEAAAAPGGDYFVQVFAGRVRQSAESLVEKLGAAGHRVRLESDDQGQERLYKVRVGGYPGRDEAEAAAERLRREGYPTAYVVSPD